MKRLMLKKDWDKLDEDTQMYIASECGAFIFSDDCKISRLFYIRQRDFDSLNDNKKSRLQKKYDNIRIVNAVDEKELGYENSDFGEKINLSITNEEWNDLTSAEKSELEDLVNTIVTQGNRKIENILETLDQNLCADCNRPISHDEFLCEFCR